MDVCSLEASGGAVRRGPRLIPFPPFVLYCRTPGLLALAARERDPSRQQAGPLVVSEGRLVRDACARALAQGVRVGATVVQARRLCPTLLAVPLETVDVRTRQRAFLDCLADLSPVVEPHGPDEAYAQMTGVEADGVVETLRTRFQAGFGLDPVIGVGASRLAAQACAESGGSTLADAAVDWLWPDLAVVGRLKRLGLTTFGSVADVGEEALRLHFGKISPVLHRRAQGVDLTPVRALYPPPTADVVIDCSEAPVDDRERLHLTLSQASVRAERQLQGLGFGRRLVLEIRTERGDIRSEWALPTPVGTALEIRRAAGRILGQMRLTAPVTRVRLQVEDVSVPAAHTADLFGAQADSVTLDATRSRLAARYGLTTLMILGKMPRTARDKRRAAVRESSWGARP